MKTTNIINQFSKLSYKEKKILLARLQFEISESKDILQHSKDRLRCGYIFEDGHICNSGKIYRHGKAVNGGTRYRCQACKHSFNVLTGTSIHYIKKKELWDRFIELMLESKSVREIAKILKMSPTTAFSWRHKILGSLETIFQKKFESSVEVDPVNFEFNQKGREKNLIKLTRYQRSFMKPNVLLMMDRKRVFDFKLVRLGKLSEKDLDREIDLSKFKKSLTIYSDSEHSIINFFEKHGFKHKTFVSNDGHGKGKLHVNTLNNAKGKINGWINYNFNSVSTKYLKNYLNWFVMMDILKKEENKSEKFWNYILTDTNAFKYNKEVEERYQKFLDEFGF